MDEPQTTEVVEQEQQEASPVVQTSNGVGAPDQHATVGGGKNIVLPHAAFNSRLQAATERGERAALAKMDEQAKVSGFTSMQDMFATVAALKAGNGHGHGQPRGNGKPKSDPTVSAQVHPTTEDHSSPNRPHKHEARWARELEKEKRQREAERRQRLQEERKRKEVERKLEAAEAEQALREQAIFAGVKDVNYAVHLLRRSIEGKTADELKGFDEGKFFDGLREEQPYLFGEVVRPVTTGTGSKAPQAPSPGKVTQGTAAGEQVDAKKMNDAEFKAHMVKRGLNLDVAGV
jgi:hypothetical protein